MKKMTVGLTLFFVLLAFAQVQAGITWESEVYEFRFEVDPNGGIVYDAVTGDLNGNASATDFKTNTQGGSDSLSDIVSEKLSEFEGAIRMNGLAKGPDDGVSPANGALVQGFAEINVSNFDDKKGIDVKQGVISWMTRRFRVDSAGIYYLSAYLSGTVNFNNFGEVDPSYHAIGSMTGKVVLEEYQEQAGAAPLKLRDVESFEWSNPSRRNDVPVQLRSDAEIFYQLRVKLILDADVKNFVLDGETITGPLTDTFEFGSADTPCEVAASISSTAGHNTPPVADAGPNQTASVEDTVTLDGSGSHDDDGDPLTYLWSFDSKPAASAAELLGPTTVNPTFVVDVAGAYVVQLIVNDGKVDSQPSTVTICTPGYLRSLSVEVAPVGSAGSVTLNPSGGIYDPGTEVTITATPDVDWYFESWSDNVADPSAATTTVTMDADKTVIATFTDQAPTKYTLTVETVGQGSVDPATGGTYDPGTEVTITATPDVDWYFESWSDNVADPSAATTTVTMDADKTVIATFTDQAPTQYTLNVNWDGLGNVTYDVTDDLGTNSDWVEAGWSQSFSEGTVVTLTAEPEEGWLFGNWKGDVENLFVVGTTVTMSAEKTVSTKFLEDSDGNGIPDDQEVGEGVDLNGDGIDDRDQTDKIKSVNTAVGDCQIGVAFVEGGGNVHSIDSAQAVDPADILDQTNSPDKLPIGLISFELTVSDPAQPAVVTVWMSVPATNNANWYKYNTIAGWNNYSDPDSGHATFSEDRKSVVLTLMDGDYGDADGIVNGVIVDPSGPDSVVKDRPHHDSSCCFIGTAASGSLFGGHAGILMIIAGCMLALAIGTYVTRQRRNMTQTD